jgi:hypothetical protein
MPQPIIDQLNALAQDQPNLLTFVEKNGTLFVQISQTHMSTWNPMLSDITTTLITRTGYSWPLRSPHSNPFSLTIIGEIALGIP